jgi:hypothetical protein
MGGQRQLGEPHVAGRHHVLGQSRIHELTQLGVARAVAVLVAGGDGKGDKFEVAPGNRGRRARRSN